LPSLDKNHFGDALCFLLVKKLLLIILLFCCELMMSNASAQVKYAFIKDTIEIKGGETFSNLLRVTNPYQQKVVLIQQGKEIYRGMIALPDSLVLQPGETKGFPLKYIADRQMIKSNIQIFSVSLASVKAAVAVQKSAAFITQLTNVGGITIGTEDNEVYLSQITNQAQVLVRVANNGFVPVSFRLVLSGIPDGLEFTGQTMSLILQPGSQQLLPFLARNKTGTSRATDYTVTIRALDGSNNELANKIVRVVSVTSARKMGFNNEMAGVTLPNSVALRYVSNSTNSSFYQLQGNGRIKTGELSSLEYRLNADQYYQNNVKGINLYNTYLDFQSKSWGLKVGNIYENVDFSLGGRGVKANVNLKNAGVLSFYGVENNYQLFNQFVQNAPAAKIYAVDYSLPNSGGGERRLTALYGRDPYTGIHVSQFSMKTGFKFKGGQVFGFEGGYSIEDQVNGSASPKQGFSGGVNYTASTDRYEFYSTGYYSSSYFTGLRRGLLQADARLLRKLDENNSLVAHVNILSSNPKYQSQLNNLFSLGINKNAIYIYELGYITKSGNIQLNFTPYYIEQHLLSSGLSSLLPDNKDWKASAVRFSTSMGYSGRIHSVSFAADYGYTFLNTSAKPPAPYHSLKLNASYNLPIFGISSYMQLNPFYLSDALSSVGNTNYTLYAVGPNFHFTTLKNNLDVRFGGMYNYYGFTKSSNYTANGNLRYQIRGHWSITGDLQYAVTKQFPILPIVNTNATTNNIYTNEPLYYNNRQFRVGIEKQFGGRRKDGVKKLQLSYYEDHNSNGKRDAGEAAVAGVLVKINGEVALTNSLGIAEFENMKKEAYKVSITNTKGWSLPEPTEVFLDKNKKLEIALVKTQALNGSIKIMKDKYASSKPEIAGIRINAMDENGQVYQTLTDDKGLFCFYLPRNKYKVYIETKGMPFSIENDTENVVLHGAPVGQLTFLYRDEHRKIGVKRF